MLINGIEELGIGSTICQPDTPDALPLLRVDEPTLTMNFCVNTSPLAGREGKFITSRQLRDRLQRELKANVALRVQDTGDETIFEVSGRGELHLTILVENMRREGFELAVSRPRVVLKEVDGVKHEPYELLTVDVEEANQGGVMEELGRRRGDLTDMQSDGKGRVRLEYRIPARGLIGFQSRVHDADARQRPDEPHLRRLRAGQGRRDGRAPQRRADQPGRRRGGRLCAVEAAGPRPHVHGARRSASTKGMIIGIHSRDNDLVVNPIKGKQLTNVRASGTDEAVRLVPPIQMTLEYAVEFIADDELVEITPQSIRLRKRHLKEHERKKAVREAA